MIRNSFTLVISFLSCLLFSRNLSAQETGRCLYIDFKINEAIAESITPINGTIFRDTSEIYESLQTVLYDYYDRGYLSASFDSLNFHDSVVRVSFNPGIQYRWGQIIFPENFPPGFPRKPNSLKSKSGRQVSIGDIRIIREYLLVIYENHGYPFASVRFDPVEIDKDIIKAGVKVEPGPEIIIDSIVDQSAGYLSPKVLEQIMGIRKNQQYSEKKILKAGQQLESSRIIQLANPLEVGFTENKAWVFISPKPLRSNSIDGMIGLLPGAGGNAGFSLSGSLDLRIINMFRQAEGLSISWKAPGNNNQRMRAGFDIPYLFGWPMGLSTSIDIFRRDTSYISTDWSAGIQAAMLLNNRFGFHYRRKSSSLLSETSNPELTDYNIKLYGISWDWEQLDNHLNPRSGFSFDTELNLGNKKLANTSNSGDDLLYWESKGNFDFFIPLGRFLVLNAGGRGAVLDGGPVYDNERFKFGGIYSLRGFNEESLLADAFFIGTIELRYLISRNSNFHAFIDGGWWQSSAADNKLSGFPVGFGAGMSIETRAGILLLDYALGFAGDIPLSLRNGKIHLGIKSLF